MTATRRAGFNITLKNPEDQRAVSPAIDVKRIHTSTVFKIIIAGDSGVGASTLLSKLLGLKTKPDKKLRSELGYRTHTIHINKQQVVGLQFWIYPNGIQEAHYLRGASAVLYLSDATKENTLDSIEKHREVIQSFNPDNDKMVEIMVLNKLDDENPRMITDEVFVQSAATNGIENKAFISAKNGINTTELLNATVAEIYARRPELEKERVAEFSYRYLKQYYGDLFANPKSGMKVGLTKGKFKTMKEIEDYASAHPDSRTAKVLRKLTK